ncbi:MAG: S9 family peptidase, partial [Pseudomonadota bacterium]|nr:S9 family peptidase [Pseudomonadota bacterium]
MINSRFFINALRVPASFVLLACILMTFAPLAVRAADTMSDAPYLWLEDVGSARSLDWARARNAETQRALESRPGYASTYAELLAIFNSQSRIPSVTRRGDWLYNFWQDDLHKRGILRRATLADYRKPDVPWQTVIDLDALGATEHENWTWKGMQCLGPQYRRCLVALSRGGADADVVREFDSTDKRFVEGGFALPEAKSSVTW